MTHNAKRLISNVATYHGSCVVPVADPPKSMHHWRLYWLVASSIDFREKEDPDLVA